MTYDQASYGVESNYVPKNVLSRGSYTMRKVTILSGQNLTVGAVLGKITASSKHILSLTAAGDGSQAVDMVLAQDCDATAGDKEAMAYYTADGIPEDILVLGAGHTIANIREPFRDKGIIIDD